MRDFQTWMQETNKTLNLPESNSTKRAGVRSHAYPALYSRGQYPDLALTPGAADAAYYLSIAKDSK